ncbi:MAG: SDR family oxidoreductase [Magnetospirillum sp.]|nr:SDR family oxidoreductase [Magnetospirillum sp.]
MSDRKQVILVSGGSRGLGLGLVEAGLAAGYSVATFSRQASPMIQSLAIQHPGSLFCGNFDVTDDAAVDSFVKSAEASLGPITGLVNNAGVVHERLLAQQSMDEIDNLLRVNLRGMLSLTRRVARGMMIRNFGRIVNISSIVSVSGYKGTVAYSATKGGIDAATRALARELGGRQITVNSVAPGYMETELTRNMNPKHLKQIVRRTPVGRPGAVSDVVGPVMFLLSDAAGFISGQTIVVDGGLSA